MGKGSSAPTSQRMPRFSGKGGVASPAPQNPYVSQQAPQSQYASPLSGLGAIYGQYQQPSAQQNPYISRSFEDLYQPQQPSAQQNPYVSSLGRPFEDSYQPQQSQTPSVIDWYSQNPRAASYNPGGPDQSALNYWTGEIAKKGYDSAFQDFTRTVAAMPDILPRPGLIPGLTNRYIQPIRQIPAAFVPQSAKNYISPFGIQKEQTYFDRTKTAPAPAPAPTPTPTPSPDDYYYPPMASGGVIKAAAGRYLQGPGDGTSDSIPATIGNAQPARLADGEFVIDARTVSEIGNGSSNAGAKKLYAMMERVHRERKKAKRGQDSNADRYLPA